jgi:predicted transcriptional regulator
LKTFYLPQRVLLQSALSLDSIGLVIQKKLNPVRKSSKIKKIKTEKIIISFRQTIATVFTFVRAILGVERYKKYVFVFLPQNFMVTVVKGKN